MVFFTTDNRRLFLRSRAEGKKKRGKSRVPQRVNRVMVESVHPNTWVLTKVGEKNQNSTSFAEAAIGLKVFHMEQDHIVKRENRARMYHRCQ